MNTTYGVEQYQSQPTNGRTTIVCAHAPFPCAHKSPTNTHKCYAHKLNQQSTQLEHTQTLDAHTNPMYTPQGYDYKYSMNLWSILELLSMKQQHLTTKDPCINHASLGCTDSIENFLLAVEWSDV